MIDAVLRGTPGAREGTSSSRLGSQEGLPGGGETRTEVRKDCVIIIIYCSALFFFSQLYFTCVSEPEYICGVYVTRYVCNLDIYSQGLILHPLRGQSIFEQPPDIEQGPFLVFSAVSRGCSEHPQGASVGSSSLPLGKCS